MSQAIYLIGAPGVGKSTLTAALLEPLTTTAPQEHDQPVAHTCYDNGWAHLGKAGKTFPGTDTLPYTAIDTIEAWLDSDDRPNRLIGEGDRLAVDRFIKCLHRNYEHVVLLHLTTYDPAITYERMLQRASEHELKPQSDAWWRGRARKAANLALRWDAHVIDARYPLQHMVAQTADIITACSQH